MVAVLVLDVIHRSGRSNGSKCHNGKSNRSSCKIEKCTLAFTPNERHSAYGRNVFGLNRTTECRQIILMGHIKIFHLDWARKSTSQPVHDV